jgi:hypothetical protein
MLRQHHESPPRTQPAPPPVPVKQPPNPTFQPIRKAEPFTLPPIQPFAFVDSPNAELHHTLANDDDDFNPFTFFNNCDFQFTYE